MGFFNLFKSNRKLKKDFNISIDFNVETSSNTSDNDDDHTIDKDFQKTIFLYSQNNSTIKENDKYPKYMLYQLGITNPKKYHEAMIKDGYFETASISEVLSSFRVSELKEILEKNNLQKSGKKIDLIQRIVDNCSQELIDTILSKNKCFTLSKKGTDFIFQHEDYIKLFKHPSWQVSVEEYKQAKAKLSTSNFNDIIWHIFNDRLLNTNICYLRNIYFNMYELLLEEDKKEQATYFLLIVFYDDLSGIENYRTIKLYLENKNSRYNFYSKKDLINEGVRVTFAPDIIDRLVSLEEYYKEEMVSKIFNTYKLPINCCTCELFKNIMNDLYNQPSLDQEYYKKEINKNYIKYIKSL